MIENHMLFDDTTLTPWKAEWQDMPEYNITDLAPQYQTIVNFVCAADVEAFGKLIGQHLSVSTNGRQLPSIWFPEQELGRMINRRYIGI